MEILGLRLGIEGMGYLLNSFHRVVLTILTSFIQKAAVVFLRILNPCLDNFAPNPNKQLLCEFESV